MEDVMYNFNTGRDEEDYEEPEGVVSGSEEDFEKQCGNFPPDVQKQIWNENFGS